MVSLVAVGCAGLGLVWGWLTGFLSGRVQHPWRTWLAAGLATVVLGAEVFWYTNWASTALCLGAAAVVLWGQLAWRSERRRCHPSSA